MDILDLVDALTRGDLLAARQWVTDARRGRIEWDKIPAPRGLDEIRSAVAAAMVELLAARAGVVPPEWTGDVVALRETIVLDPGLEQMPRSYAHAKAHGPESLRKRNLVALPDFLDVA